MTNFYLPLAVAVAGMLFYHLAQKSIPKGINPFFATIIAYLTGIVVCAVCAFAFPGNKSLVASVKESNWAVYVVGAAAACIEVGFLLAYWKLSVAAVATNVAVTVMLVPIGIIVFKDQLSLRNVLGLVFCLVGLVLVVRDSNSQRYQKPDRKGGPRSQASPLLTRGLLTIFLCAHSTVQNAVRR